MPLATETIDIDDEIERLDDERQSKAQEQAEYPPSSNAAQQLAAEGQQADRYRKGLLWLRDNYDVSEITLSALTNGERRRVSNTDDANPYSRADIYVSAGSYDAPWVEHDPESVSQDDFEETIRNVLDLDPALVDWMNQRIGSIDTVGGETGKSYATLVLENRIRAASPTNNG